MVDGGSTHSTSGGPHMILVEIGRGNVEFLWCWLGLLLLVVVWVDVLPIRLSPRRRYIIRDIGQVSIDLILFHLLIHLIRLFLLFYISILQFLNPILPKIHLPKLALNGRNFARRARLRVRGEVVVGQRLLGGESLGGVQGEELEDKINSFLIEQFRQMQAILHSPLLQTLNPYRIQILLQALLPNLRIVLPFLLVGLDRVGEKAELQRLLPALLCRHAQLLINARQLVHIGVPFEYGLAGEHFGDEAANGPHVNSFAVEWIAEKQLGSTIPPRDNLGGEVEVVDALEVAGQTEVSDLEYAVLGEQDVAALDVAMHDAALMQVRHAFDELLY